MPTNTNNTKAVCHDSGLFKSVKSQIARLTISILLEPPQGKCFFFINLFAGSSPPKKHEEKRASWFFIFQVSCCTIRVCYRSQCTEDGCQGPWIKSEGLSRSKHASHASQMHHRFPCVTWTTSFRRIEHLASHNRSVLNHKINPKLTAAQGTSKISVYSEYILALV